MSYLSDKRKCKECGDLFDTDLLNDLGECRGCVIDNEMLNEIVEDYQKDD